MARVTSRPLSAQEFVRRAPGALVLWSRAEGRLCCEAISEGLARIDGASVEEHLGRSPSDVLPEIGPSIEAAIDSVFDTGRPCVVEIGGPTPASTVIERSFRAEYVPVFGDDRTSVELVIGRVDETTELHRSEMRLRLLDTSGELLGSTLDARRSLTMLADMLIHSITDFAVIRLLAHDSDMPEVFLVRHRDPRVEQHVRKVIERHALPADSAIGPPAVIATARPELLADFARARHAFASSPAHERELEELGIRSLMSVPLTVAAQTNGAITLGRIEKTVPFDEDDVVTMVEIARRAGIAVDNALVHAHAAQLASAADALEQLDEGVVMLGPDGRVQRINTAAETLLGVHRADVIGRQPHGVGACLAAMIDSAVDVEPGARSARADAIECPAAPTPRWVSVARTIGPTGVVYTLHDITSTRDLQQITSEFLATVSHELRTPLTILRGASQTLRDLAGTMDPQDSDQMLHSINSQAVRLQRIVTEILTSQQLDVGTITLHPRATDVVHVAREAITDLAAIAPEGIDLRDELPRAPAIARADPDALRQILDNLLDNAIRYSPDGGTIALRARIGDDVIVLEVSDEGAGIPFVDRDRVFEKFVRLDPHHRHFKSGSGLGLYVSRELARRMAGDVTIAARAGVGTTFEVTLPIAPAGDDGSP